MLCEYFLFIFAAGIHNTFAGEPPVIAEFIEYDLVLPGDVEAETGFYLPCEASGTPPVGYLWQHNGRNIKYGAQYQLIGSGTLEAKFLDHRNNGEYQCFARNAFGVSFSRRIQVNVTVAGRFSFENDKIAPVTRGKPIEIPCPRHSPSFGVTYLWGHRDPSDPDIFRTFYEDDRVAVTMDGTLVIMYVTQRDIDRVNGMGGIQCKISTTEQRTYSHRISFQEYGREFTGTMAADIYISPMAVEIAREGLDKRLYCLAVGKPAPDIIWDKDGTVIIDGMEGFELPPEHHNRLLIITNAEKGQHEGNYTCSALSTGSFFPKASATTFLSVKVSPVWNLELPRKSTIEQHKNLTLKCIAWGDPLPSYRWYRNARQILFSDSNVKLYGNVLLLTNAIQWHEAVFQCVAENDQGMNVTSTWVHVLDEEDPTQISTPSPTAKPRKAAIIWIVVPVILALLFIVMVAFLVVYLRRQNENKSRAGSRVTENNAFDDCTRNPSVTRLELGQSSLTGTNRSNGLPPLPHYESLDPTAVADDIYDTLDSEPDLNESGLYESLDFRNGNRNKNYQKPIPPERPVPEYLELVENTNSASRVSFKRPGNYYDVTLNEKAMNDVENTSPMSRDFYEPMGGCDVNRSVAPSAERDASATGDSNCPVEQAGPSSSGYYVPMAGSGPDGPLKSSKSAPEIDIDGAKEGAGSLNLVIKGRTAPEYYVPMTGKGPDGPLQSRNAASNVDTDGPRTGTDSNGAS